MSKTETTALPAALRDHARGPSTDHTHKLMRQAADEIERLRAELDAAKADIAMLIEKESSDVTPRPLPLEVRRNDDGSLDEVVCDGAYVHLEQMNGNHWWMAVEHKGKLTHVNFYAHGKITAACEEQ